VRKEEVPAHLASHCSVSLFHLRFDQRVPNLPHYGLSAVAFDVVVQVLRGLYFADGCGARRLSYNLTCEDEHQLIAPDDAAVFIYPSNAIGVAVKSDRQISLMLAHGVDRELHVFNHSGIGMMIWKST